MKLNLEVELDWIDEEMGIDDTIKQNVINTIVAKIQHKIQKETEVKINRLIDETIVDKINEKTEALFDDFMNKEISLSDNYGSVIKTYDNTSDLIKERFDNFMTQKVDDNGKLTKSTYGTTHRRIDWVVNYQLKKFADKFTTDAVKQVSAEIKMHVKEGLTNKLGAELMHVLKVDKMLELKK